MRIQKNASLVFLFLIICSLFCSTDVHAQNRATSINTIKSKYQKLYTTTNNQPLFYSIESFEFSSDTTALVTVNTESVSEINDEPSVTYRLLKHKWSYRNADWHMQKQEHEISSTEGEFIPSPNDPQSEAVQNLIQSLKKSNPQEQEQIWRSLNGKLPFVESIKSNENYRLVSFIWREAANDVRISLYGELPFHPGGLDRALIHVPGTDLWYQTLRVPADARTSYGFDIIRTYTDKKTNKLKSYIVSVTDHRNAKTFGDVSVLELPIAPPQPYIAEIPGIKKGILSADSIHSQKLNEQRKITIYTPPNYSSSIKYPLLIIFDGAVYGGNKNATKIPTPTILDNLVGKGLIKPVVCILIHQKKRETELAGNDNFTYFLVQEAIPFVKEKYNITDDPFEVLAAGSSVGGFAAIYAAYKYPNVIGNALSQSGAFWLPKNVNDPVRQEYVPPQIWFAQELIKNPKRDIRIWMEISKLESAAKMLGPNREIRDILQLKQYDVMYREVNSGHDYLHWRGSLAEGLIALFGK